MERNNIAAASNGNSSQIPMGKEEQNVGGGVLGWWYRHFAPLQPPATASFSQREKARHGKLASIAVPVFMLFVLTYLPQAMADRSPLQLMTAFMGLAGGVLAIFLNRRGFVAATGILVLILVYVGSTIGMLSYPGGMTTSTTSQLDFSIIPDMLVLAFFSANSLLPIVCINIIQAWAVVTYGPHDGAITHLLQTSPLQIFGHGYVLQLVTAATLYLWARSTELALKRADRAEEIAAFEKRENERQQRELERKHKLDVGVQQLLQTMVAAANGDLKVRAPLSKDHILWQVAVALNNLIARLQSLSYIENELQQQKPEESERATGHHIKAEAGKIVRPEVAGTTERARGQQIREGNERVVSLRARAEAGKEARPEPGGIVERIHRQQEQQVLEEKKGTAAEAGKVAHPEPGGIAERVRKRSEGAVSPPPPGPIKGSSS
jgi:hypothetical protein